MGQPSNQLTAELPGAMAPGLTSSTGPGGGAEGGVANGGTWANMVVKGNAQSRKKLNILNVHLDRDSKST